MGTKLSGMKDTMQAVIHWPAVTGSYRQKSSMNYEVKCHLQGCLGALFPPPWSSHGISSSHDAPGSWLSPQETWSCMLLMLSSMLGVTTWSGLSGIW